MLNRYTIYSDKVEIEKLFGIELNLIAENSPRYNAGPGSIVPVIIAGKNRERTLVGAKWSSGPFAIGSTKTSILKEDFVKNVSLQKTFQRKRCLILMNGYFDWKKITETIQLAFYFRLLNTDLFVVAGLYENESDLKAINFLPIETESNEIVEPLSASMPAIIDFSDIDMWLDPLSNDAEGLIDMIKPLKTSEMSSYRVALKNEDRESNTKEVIQPLV
jgi:putative SOS response-associated peptidase YedK